MRVGFYLQYAVPVAGNRAMHIQHIIFGVDPPDLEQKEQMQELKLFTKQGFVWFLGELWYLQSKSCDVNISQHARHLFSFKNLCRVLHEHQTCSHYCAKAKLQRLVKTEVCEWVSPLRGQKLLVCDEFWFARDLLVDL